MIRVVGAQDSPAIFPRDGQESTLSQFLSRNGVRTELPCGGHGRCGKCKVRASGDLSEPDAQERASLSAAELASGFRLACRARLLGENAEIFLPERETIHVETRTLLGELEWSADAAGLGLSVDIGTTTVAAYLWDSAQRRLLGVQACKNPQETFGADVISRLEASLRKEGPALQACICGCIAELAQTLCTRAGRHPKEITQAVFTGNTAMLYLLCGYDANDLAFAPFDAAHLFGEFRPAAQFGFAWGEACRVYLPPCISAYVGADVTCGLLACEVLTHGGTALLADVGTNGEMALLHGGKLYCCATAAGPAFEGVGISCGSGAVAGAIDRVTLEGNELRIHTIGDLPDRSLCGSGLMDAVSCLVQRGDVEDTGYMEEDSIPLGSGTALTRGDIRSFQLAKSAICAGIEALLSAAEITAADVETMWLAGGFGSKLSPESAAKIGLFPTALAGKVQPVGNAAAAGAARLLCGGLTESVCKIVSMAQLVELAGDAVFQQKFMENMILGEV